MHWYDKVLSCCSRWFVAHALLETCFFLLSSPLGFCRGGHMCKQSSSIRFWLGEVWRDTAAALITSQFCCGGHMCKRNSSIRFSSVAVVDRLIHNAILVYMVCGTPHALPPSARSYTTYTTSPNVIPLGVVVRRVRSASGGHKCHRILRVRWRGAAVRLLYHQRVRIFG